METTAFLNISKEIKYYRFVVCPNLFEVCVNEWGSESFLKTVINSICYELLVKVFRNFGAGVNFCICNYQTSKVAEVDDMPNLVSVSVYYIQ